MYCHSSFNTSKTKIKVEIFSKECYSSFVSSKYYWKIINNRLFLHVRVCLIMYLFYECSTPFTGMLSGTLILCTNSLYLPLVANIVIFVFQ